MPANRVEWVNQPFVGPSRVDTSGYGRTLADLLYQRGNQTAAIHLQRGDAAARSWGQAGASIAGAVDSWRQSVAQKRQQEIENAREQRTAEAQGIQMDAAKLQLGRAQRQDQGEQVARDLLPLAQRQDGVVGYDRAFIQRELESAGHADMVPQVFQQLDAQEEAHLKVKALRRDAVAGDAFRLLQSGGDERSFNSMIALWEANDAVPQAEIEGLRNMGKTPEGRQRALLAAVNSSPTFAEQVRKMQDANAPKLKGFAQDQTIVDERTGEVVREGTAKPANLQSVQALVNGKPGMVSFNPQTGGYQDAQGNPVADVRPIPPREPQGPQTPIAVIGPDGKPVLVRPADAIGMTPANTKETVSGADLPGPYRNALDRATLNLAATKRPTVQQLANRLASEGDMEGLADVIRQAAVEGENVDTKNQILGRRAMLASLTDTRAILDELKQKGVPTGMLSGSVEDLARKLGTSTNPEYVALANRLQGTLINYRRAATGAAFGEREGAAYEKMFPNYRNTMPVNLALIDGLEREAATYDREYWTHKLGADGASLVGVVPKSGGKAPEGAAKPDGDGWQTIDGIRVRVKP